MAYGSLYKVSDLRKPQKNKKLLMAGPLRGGGGGKGPSIKEKKTFFELLKNFCEM